MPKAKKKPEKKSDTKIVSRTHFEKKYSESQGQWSWYWRTEAANHEPVAVGGEGYARLDGALNGFMSSQGQPEWQPGEVGNRALPEGYILTKFTPQHYVVTQLKINTEDKKQESE